MQNVLQCHSEITQAQPKNFVAKVGQHSSRYRPYWSNRLRDAWLVITGRCSLHLAWQSGHDHGTHMEYRRTVVNGGR